MPRKGHLGDLEQLILLSILRLRDEAYGMAIRRELEERGGRSVSIATVYIALEKLEDKGFVRSQLGQASPDRGGRAKKYFSVNPSGQDALARALKAINDLSDGTFPLPEAI